MTHERGAMHVKVGVINDSEQMINKLDGGTEWRKHEDLQDKTQRSLATKFPQVLERGLLCCSILVTEYRKVIYNYFDSNYEPFFLSTFPCCPLFAFQAIIDIFRRCLLPIFLFYSSWFPFLVYNLWHPFFYHQHLNRGAV